MSAKRRLAKGRKIRRHMASQLDLVRHAQLHVEDVIRTPTNVLGRCTIHTLLLAAPGLGHDGVKRILTSVDVWPYDRVAGLPPEKREAIIAALPERARKR